MSLPSSPLPLHWRLPLFFSSLAISSFLAGVLMVVGAGFPAAASAFGAVWLLATLFFSPLLFLGVLLIVRAAIDSFGDLSVFSFENRFSLTASQAFGIFVVLILGIALPFLRRSIRRLPLFLPLLLFILWGVSTLFVSVDPSLSSGTGYEIVRLTTILLVFLFAFSVVRSEADWRFLLGAILASAFIPLLLAMIQITTGAGYRDEAFALPRASGSFAHPNVFALYFVGMTAASILFFTSARTGAKKFSGTLFFLFSLGAVIVSYTRIAWLALATLIGAVSLRRDFRLLPILLIITLFFYAFVAPVRDRVDEAFSLSSTSSLVWRVNTWSDAIGYTFGNNREVFGFGLNTFATVLGNLRGETFVVNDPHSEFVRAFVEGGFVGLAVTTLFFFLILRTFFSLWRHSKTKKARNIFFTLFALWGALTLASLTDHVLRSTPLQWLIWSLLGGAFAVYLPKKKSHRDTLPLPKEKT